MHRYIYSALKDTPSSKKIICIICNIGKPINRIFTNNIPRPVEYINIEYSCQENYNRMYDDYIKYRIYAKFCDIYNVYRKIYI